MAAQALRIFLFRIHAWLGLNTCILLGVMFATGTLLVFSYEWETAFYSKVRSGEYPGGGQVSFGTVYDAARTAYPDVQIESIQRSDNGALFGDRVPIRTAWGERAYIWVDSGTGEVLGTSPKESARHILLLFHDSLFSGNWMGRAAVSLLAFSLLGSVVTGLIAYRRFWRALKTPPPRGRGARPWWGGLHRFVAVWSLPFLLVVGVTGIYYFVSTLNVIPTKGPKVPPASERAETLPPGFDGAALDRAVAAARAAVPELDVQAVVLPYTPKHGITVAGPEGGSPVHFSTHRVIVDPQTMQVMATIAPPEFSPKDQAKHFFDALHHGDWAGNYSRFAWLFFGAAGTLLMFSGAMVFAARIARVPQAGKVRPQPRSAAGRVWRGMFILKWGLVPLALAIAAVGVYRFYWKADRWTNVAPETASSVQATLAVYGSLRAGEALPVRVRLDGVDQDNAEISFRGEVIQNAAVQPEDNGMSAKFQVQPGADRNMVSVTVSQAGGASETLTWVLGRPLD